MVTITKGIAQQNKERKELEYKELQIKNTALQGELEKASHVFQTHASGRENQTNEDYLKVVSRIIKKYNVADNEAKQIISRVTSEKLKPI